MAIIIPSRSRITDSATTNPEIKIKQIFYQQTCKIEENTTRISFVDNSNHIFKVNFYCTLKIYFIIVIIHIHIQNSVLKRINIKKKD